MELPAARERHICQLPQKYPVGAIWRCDKAHLWRCEWIGWSGGMMAIAPHAERRPAPWWLRYLHGGRKPTLCMRPRWWSANNPHPTRRLPEAPVRNLDD